MDEKCLNNNYWGSFRILFSVAAGWLILIITHTKDGRRQQQPSTIETNPPSPGPSDSENKKRSFLLAADQAAPLSNFMSFLLVLVTCSSTLSSSSPPLALAFGIFQSTETERSSSSSGILIRNYNLWFLRNELISAERSAAIPSAVCCFCPSSATPFLLPFNQDMAQNISRCGGFKWTHTLLWVVKLELCAC